MKENVERFSPHLLAVMIIASLTITKNLRSISQIGFLDGFSVVLLSKFMQISVSLSLNSHMLLHFYMFSVLSPQDSEMAVSISAGYGLDVPFSFPGRCWKFSVQFRVHAGCTLLQPIVPLILCFRLLGC
jgi:hypothetical protein